MTRKYVCPPDIAAGLIAKFGQKVGERPSAQWPYGQRTYIQYLSPRGCYEHEVYYCHGHYARVIQREVAWLNSGSNEVTKDDFNLVSVTWLTDVHGVRAGEREAAAEWWRFLFSDQSPYHSVLRAFMPIWHEKFPDQLRGVAQINHTIPARKAVNFLIACRWPTFEDDNMSTYMESRKLGYSIPVSMLVSQVLGQYILPGRQKAFGPFPTRNNKFWFWDRSVPAFVQGEMHGGSGRSIIQASGIPNISIWDDKKHYVRCRLPRNWMEYQFSPDIVQGHAEFFKKAQGGNTATLNFRTFYAGKLNENLWS